MGGGRADLVRRADPAPRRAREVRDCARATLDVAAKLYGARSEPHRAVEQAWRSVGIDVAALATAGPHIPIFEPAAEVPVEVQRPAPQRRPRRAVTR